MPVLYDGNALVPAPFVNITKDYDKTADDQIVGATFRLSLRGTIVAHKGSPNSSGVFGLSNPDEVIAAEDKLTAIFRKQEAIRNAFASDGRKLDFTPWGTGTSMSCYPRVVSIEFPEGPWHTLGEYVINLEADVMTGGSDADEDPFVDADGCRIFIKDASEEWNLEFNNEVVQGHGDNNPYTFRLTHTLSATGKTSSGDGTYHTKAWEEARKWVKPRMGIDNNFMHSTSGLHLPSYYAGYDHVRSEVMNEVGGQYSITETWLLSSGNYTEDFNITTRTSTDTNTTTVTIEGTINGHDTRNANFAITTSKWNAANTYWSTLSGGGTLFTRAQTYSGVTLNSSALSTQVSKNPNTGVITYNYEYDSRPSTCITGVIQETITITDVNPVDHFALIPVLGRSVGPILQSLGTIKEQKRTVSIEVISGFPTGCPCDGIAAYMLQSPSGDVNTVMQCFEDQLVSNYDQVFLEADQRTWIPTSGKYSASKTWVFQSCS